MKIKRIKEIEGTAFTGGVSFRALVQKDSMGFGLNKTVIPKGGPYHWHYPHHLEACYCIKGRGELVDLKTGIKHLIVPDVVYVLDNHDDHTFEAFEDTVLISVFNPPLYGNETHDENGHYPSPQTSLTRAKATQIYDTANSASNRYDAIELIQSLIG